MSRGCNPGTLHGVGENIAGEKSCFFIEIVIICCNFSQPQTCLPLPSWRPYRLTFIFADYCSCSHCEGKFSWHYSLCSNFVPGQHNKKLGWRIRKMAWRWPFRYNRASLWWIVREELVGEGSENKRLDEKRYFFKPVKDKLRHILGKNCF